MICRLNNISKFFGSKVILKDFSLNVNKGDFICIVGKSGTGKSTLINMMGLLEKPNEGSIDMLGFTNVLPNTKLSQKLLRNNIGFLFQSFALIDDKTVSYNLDIASINKNKLTKDKKQAILDKLEINVSLKEKVYNLSGGEQQRLALARILIKDCDIIFADEPTGSLDAENSDIVLNILKQLNQNGKTIITVSHDLTIKDYCNRIIQL